MKANKPKIKAWSTKVPLYSNVNFHLVVGENMENMRDYYIRRNPNEKDGNGVGAWDTYEGLVCWNSNGDVWMVFSPEGLTPATIAHEAFHAAHRILELVGDDFDKDHHEPYAYLVGWMMSYIYGKLKGKTVFTVN